MKAGRHGRGQVHVCIQMKLARLFASVHCLCTVTTSGQLFVAPAGDMLFPSRNGNFLLAANSHFMALRKQDGCLELNPGCVGG